MGSESPEVVADPVAEQAAEPVAEQAAESAVEPNDDELIEIVADEPATATAGSASSIPKEPITDGTPDAVRLSNASFGVHLIGRNFFL